MRMKSLNEKVYNHIYKKLRTGHLQAGSSISETTMARELSVSRTPVREAIRRLESEGLVRQIPRFGTFIRELTLEEFQDLWEVRIVLEQYAASRAAARISDTDLKKMELLIRQMRKIAHLAKTKKQNAEQFYKLSNWVELDLEFHRLVSVAADNPVVIEMREKNSMLTDLVITYARKATSDPDPFKGIAVNLLEHYRILCAMRDRNSEAAKYWMGRHLTSAGYRMAKWLKGHFQKEKTLNNYGDNFLSSLMYTEK